MEKNAHHSPSREIASIRMVTLCCVYLFDNELSALARFFHCLITCLLKGEESDINNAKPRSGYRYVFERVLTFVIVRKKKFIALTQNSLQKILAL